MGKTNRATNNWYARRHGRGKTAAARRRSRAAFKAWETRRANAAAARRSAAAKKAVATRRARATD